MPGIQGKLLCKGNYNEQRAQAQLSFALCYLGDNFDLSPK